MSGYEDDLNENEQGPKALRDAVEKANKELKALREQNEKLQKQVATQGLEKILADKKVPANVQRWLKRDDVEPTAEAVDKWLSENGADFGWKPGETEGSEDATSEEAPAQAAPAAQSVLTPELSEALARFNEVFGAGSGAPVMPADQVKAAVDDVAGQVDVGTDYNQVVAMLRDKGIPMGGEITYV